MTAAVGLIICLGIGASTAADPDPAVEADVYFDSEAEATVMRASTPRNASPKPAAPPARP